MYQPSQFRLEDIESLTLAIEQSPFTTPITADDADGFNADHLPLPCGVGIHFLNNKEH